MVRYRKRGFTTTLTVSYQFPTTQMAEHTARFLDLLKRENSNLYSNFYYIAFKSCNLALIVTVTSGARTTYDLVTICPKACCHRIYCMTAARA